MAVQDAVTLIFLGIFRNLGIFGAILPQKHVDDFKVQAHGQETKFLVFIAWPQVIKFLIGNGYVHNLLFMSTPNSRFARN